MKNRLQGIVIGIIIGALLSTAVLAAPVSELISVVFDNYKIMVNGENKAYADDMKPLNYNGRIYVPLRFAAETLHKSVNWDANTKTVYIDDSEEKDFILTPKENLSDDELSACAEIIDMRLKNAEIKNYTLSVFDGSIVISAPESVTKEQIEQCVVKGYLHLNDSESHIILDKKDIQSAYTCYDDLTGTGIKQHYVEILLNSDGRRKLSTASADIAKKENNKNYIAVMVDDVVYSTPFVTGAIESDRIVITGYFTESSAASFAAVLSTAELPMEFKVEE